jgi:flavin-dependent dehydrogenase
MQDTTRPALSSASPSRPIVEWDAIILGGALSGAATARLILRENPALRVLILEKNPRFQRRVGESTVELSAYFLGRQLGLTEYLNQNHLMKQGLRFWFQNERTQGFTDCSEIGPGYNVRLPGYQVDRATLDEKVLADAVVDGAQLRRPAKVTDVQLVPGGAQRVAWTEGATAHAATARWVIDATGLAAVLARKNDWLQPNDRHPTASAWSRWRGVLNWEDRKLLEKYPEWARRAKGVRGTATNHLIGYGWWAWWIPLKGGDVSIGVVWDQRLTDLPPGENLGARLKAHLLAHPIGRELLGQAELCETDLHVRRNLAYASERMGGDGFALVGDAAAFMDPFYSPGMDWICYGSNAAAAMVAAERAGGDGAMLGAKFDQDFRESAHRWFEALYLNKYYYMGDFELMRLAFRLDLGLYYLGPAVQPWKHGEYTLAMPSFAGPKNVLPWKIMAGYTRRLAAIARSRRARGTWGRHNAGHRLMAVSYEFNHRLPFRVLRCFCDYALLELREGWRTWFSTPAIDPAPARSSRRPVPQSAVAPAPLAAPV